MFPWMQKTTVAEVVQAIEPEIVETLGDNLVSLIIYGDHADTSKAAKDSEPADLLIVVNDVGIETLVNLAKAFEGQSHNGLISPMILSLEELRGSTDVFPIKFMEMQRVHRLLAGKDILADLEIGGGHLRLRCEQELKNILFRMQSAYLRQSRTPKRLAFTLHRSYAAFLKTMRAALSLVDQEAAEDERELLAQLGEHFELPVDALSRVGELAVVVDANFGADGVTSVFGEFLLIVHRAANAVDALPDVIVLSDEISE